MQPPTSAGKMRHRFEIQKNDPTRSAMGVPVPNWVTIDEVWGAIEQVKGEERYIPQQVTATASHVVTMRYHPEVKAPRQLKMDGDRVFDINGVTNLEERNRWLVVIVQELKEPQRGN